MLRFLETDIRELIYDLHYEIKFENLVKDKITFLLSDTMPFFFKQNIFYSWRRIFF